MCCLSRSSAGCVSGFPFCHAVERGFRPAFARYDGPWPGHQLGALDASIKHQTLNGLHLVPTSDDLPEFGESFAATAVSNAVDTTVTQNNLGMLVDQAIPAAVPVSQPNISFASLAAHASVRFARLDQFVAEVPLPGHERETPLRIEMRIQGWRWKITNVEFPLRGLQCFRLLRRRPTPEI